MLLLSRLEQEETENRTVCLLPSTSAPGLAFPLQEGISWIAVGELVQTNCGYMQVLELLNVNVAVLQMTDWIGLEGTLKGHPL